MSVADARKAPFVWASTAALAHLRRRWDDGAEDAQVRPSVGLSVYHALCEIANDDRARTAIGSDSGAFRTSLKTICERAGVSDKPVARALLELERIGLLTVERNNADQGKRAGAASAYTLLEPAQTIGSSPEVEPTEKVRTTNGRSPNVPSEKGRTSLHIGKKGKKEENPCESPPKSKVGGKSVTDAEYLLADAIIAAFNASAGTGYRPDSIDHLRPIVLRIREFPDLSVEDHRGIIAAVFAIPWWTGAPGPQVIYGSKGQFERSIETWRAAPRGARLQVVPGGAVAGRGATKMEARRLIRARARLRAELPDSTYRLWVRRIRFAGLTADTVYLSAPEEIRAWAERRYSALLAVALDAEGLPADVSFAAVEITDRREAA